ncbi:MAG: S8 family serine peptidase [Candidatus Acidiferrales bacterium]
MPSGLLANFGEALTEGVAPRQDVIVRTSLGISGLQNVCLQEGCSVVGNLDGSLGQVFLVQPTQPGLLASALASVLRLVTGIVDAEVDQVVAVPPNPTNETLTTSPPGGLWDRTTDNYYGSNAWDGYVSQPAVQIINLQKAQDTFNVGGAGIVADIDTGVDPNHPVLKDVLLEGYDFTRNQPGGSELRDISGAPPPCSNCVAAYVNQHTVAMVDQHTAAMVDGTAYAAFGHGTMVAGIIHLTAPTAQILPLKSFHADGTGNLSDILRAVYYAVQNNANVINMSFDLTENSTELADAIKYAVNSDVICVASSGNDGEMEVVYPAALPGVMGVASTNDQDQRSNFSNYGDQVVWVAAPGEGIVTTYPFGNYAAGWGTSFSSPFVAGTAALILEVHHNQNPAQVAGAVSHAKWIGANMGYGRIDVYNTLWSLDLLQGVVGLLQ